MNQIDFTIDKNNIGETIYYTLKCFGKMFGKCLIIKHAKQHEYIIKYIEIKEAFRCKGLGKVLWDYVEKDILGNNGTIVHLETDEIYSKYNKLVKLYQSWGFIRSDDKERINNLEIEPTRCIKMHKMLV